MNVVVEDVAVPVPVRALLLHGVPHPDRLLVMHLVGNDAVVRRLAPLEGGRQLALRPHDELDVPRVFSGAHQLLMLRVVELLRHRVEAVLLRVLLRALEEVEVLGLAVLLLVVLGVPVVQNVEVLHEVRVQLAPPRLHLLFRRAVFRPRPVVLREGQVGQDVVVLDRRHAAVGCLTHVPPGARVAAKQRGVLTWRQCLKPRLEREYVVGLLSHDLDVLRTVQVGHGMLALLASPAGLEAWLAELLQQRIEDALLPLDMPFGEPF
mmetsp:Transcript_102431/g.305944  ORF Transcript_102431/g.305944 Transcript_102431/m.305944 type:complete len:264 (-) Transcript_102431:176-967(-)